MVMDAWEILKSRGFVQQVTHEDELKSALSGGRITYYVGFDPTADSLHVGHLLQVIVMSWLQKCGHQPIAVVGGGTAMVGDPSGKSEMRQMLTPEQIRSNTDKFKVQLSQFLEFGEGKGRMVDNADWLLSLNYISFLRDIGRHFSVNRMLAAEAYKLRLERGLSFIEFNYQILQAYDFLELFRRHGCSLQIGGDDQWGNILAGADLIRRLESKPAFGLTTPLITTASGAKMGKTEKGALFLDPNRTPVFDFYQYWLNVDDRDVGRFLRFYTFLPLDEIVRLEALQGAEIREAKRILAHTITATVHGEAAAQQAGEAGRAMVEGRATEDLPTHPIAPSALAEGLKVNAVLADSGLAKSRSEARQLIKNGGVMLGARKVDDTEASISADEIGADGVVLRVGKKRAVRLSLAE
jgi:tyrosyl-tRNA synthetase